MTDAQDELGKAIDHVDSLAHALVLPISAELYVNALKNALPETVADLKKYFIAVTGENPWD